jgi:hypothetical protein
LFQHGVVALLGLCRRYVANGLQEPPVVEPVDPFQGRELDSTNPDDPSQMWSGRGKRPQWVTGKLASGLALEELSIGHGLSVAAMPEEDVSGSTTTRVGLIGLTSGRDQAARRALVWSAQAHGSSSSSFCIGQPLTSLARVSAR